MATLANESNINDIVLLHEVEWSELLYSSNYQRLQSVFRRAKVVDNVNELKASKLYFLVFREPVEIDSSFVGISPGLKELSLFLASIELRLKNNVNVVNYILSYDYYEYCTLFNLVLGHQAFKDIGQSAAVIRSSPKKIERDIVGANNWSNLSELFDILNLTCNWLVLRNYESLSNDYVFESEDDIDILCDNIEKLVSIMNAKNRPGGRCSYVVVVNKMTVLLDIRFTGDKYYDPAWERDMLNNKKYKGIVPTLSSWDYFFGLIYHVKLQKNFVKPDYPERLDDLAKLLNFTTLPKNFIYKDAICADLLNHFFVERGYHYTYTDNALRNEEFLKLIKRKEINDLCGNLNCLKRFVFATLKKEFSKLPVKIKNKLLIMLRLK